MFIFFCNISDLPFTDAMYVVFARVQTLCAVFSKSDQSFSECDGDVAFWQHWALEDVRMLRFDPAVSSAIGERLTLQKNC